MEPDLPHSLVDVVHGYFQRLAIEHASHVRQEGKDLSLSPIGHTQALGHYLVNEIVRYQCAQLFEVECGEEFYVVLDDFKLGRRGFGEHVGLRGHFPSLMVLVSGRFNIQSLPFISPLVLVTKLTVWQGKTSFRKFTSSGCRAAAG
jgi:hypothetical protein